MKNSIRRFKLTDLENFIYLIMIISSVSCSSLSNNAAAKLSEIKIKYTSQSWTIREEAVSSIDSFNDDGTELFLSIAAKDPHQRVRCSAIALLQNYKTERSRLTLISAALNDESPNVRWLAEQSLIIINNHQDADVFYKLLNDKDWLVRETAVQGYMININKSEFYNNIPVIINLLNDPSDNVRITLLKYLSHPDNRIYLSLKKQLYAEELKYRPEYLSLLLRALSIYKLEIEVRTYIINLITHPNENVRLNALNCVKSSDNMK